MGLQAHEISMTNPLRGGNVETPNFPQEVSMKAIAAILGLALLCHSTLAVAAGPIPFSELAKNAGVHPATPLPLASDDKTASAQPGQTLPLTSGQKAMIVGGIVCAGVGVALLGLGASANPSGILGSQVKDAFLGAGGGLAGTGVVLIAFGAHHHHAK